MHLHTRVPHFRRRGGDGRFGYQTAACWPSRPGLNFTIFIQFPFHCHVVTADCTHIQNCTLNIQVGQHHLALGSVQCRPFHTRMPVTKAYEQHEPTHKCDRTPTLPFPSARARMHRYVRNNFFAADNMPPEAAVILTYIGRGFGRTLLLNAPTPTPPCLTRMQASRRIAGAG